MADKYKILGKNLLCFYIRFNYEKVLKTILHIKGKICIIYKKQIIVFSIKNGDTERIAEFM